MLWKTCHEDGILGESILRQVNLISAKLPDSVRFEVIEVKTDDRETENAKSNVI